MEKIDTIRRLIISQGLLPLFFHSDKSVSIEILKALYNAGIRVVEYTNRGEEALDNFKELKKICINEFPDMLLGAGTIKNAVAGEAFINAGADFLVSPGMAEDILELVNPRKILWIPGCMTPTEIIKAEKYGVKLIKLFPGHLLGPQFMIAIKELFPDLLFMPTGGIELEIENLKEWFNAGVCAVGMGSKLIPKSAVNDKNYILITTLTKKYLDIIKEIRTIN